MKRVLLFLCLFFCAQSYGQSIDSLVTVYREATGRFRIDAANDIAKALEESNDSLYVFSEKDSKTYIDAVLLTSLAYYYYNTDNFNETIKIAQEAVPLLEQLKDSIWLTDNYATMGGAYQRTGDFDKALECSEKCLEIETSLGDLARQSSSMNDLAGIYLANKRYDIAIEYLNRAIAIERDLNRSLNLAIRLGMISSAYLNLGELDKALSTIQEALDLDRKGNREGKAAIRLSQIGDIFLAKNDLIKARQYYSDALDTFDKLSMDNSASICLLQLGGISARLGNIPNANKELGRCVELCKRTGNKYILQKAYEKLFTANKKSNPALAIEYYEKHNAIKDSIFNLEKQKQISNFQIKYDVQNKEHQIELQTQTIEQQKFRNKTLLGLIILIILILILVYYMVILQKRRNIDLVELNKTKDKMISIVSHDLKNPVLAQKITLQNLINAYDYLDKEQIKEQCKALLNNAEAQTDLLQNLLTWTLLHTGRLTCNPIRFDIEGAVKENARLLSLQMNNKDLTLDISIPKTAMAFADRNMFNIVMQNLLSNAVKFSYRKGEIRIVVEPDDADYRISVIDSGVGMDEKQQSTIGTDGEKGTGLGLSLCRQLININGGRLFVESRKGEGTKIYFKLKSGDNSIH